MKFGLSKTETNSKRHYFPVMAFGVLFVLLVIIFTYISISHPKSLSEETIPELQPVEKSSVKSPRLAPTRLVIPKIHVDANFVQPLVLQSDQTVSVPNSYTEVGWYSGGSAPGEVGPAVILGHVDSKSGPAVFYSLGQLKIGDEIQITQSDSNTLTFIVTKLERYPQSDFPTLAVYGPTDDVSLRLVTCSGIFSKGIQRYSHNLVVYAVLKPTS